MRHFLKSNSWLLGLLVILSGYTEKATLHQRSRTLPSILILIADDAGWKDFGCYNHPVIKTPHIDRLAATGLKFTNAFLTSSSCSPSRTSILSGKYAHSIGTEDMHVPIPDSVTLLPGYLKQKNYYTGHMFKTHYGPAGEKQFDWYGNQPNRFAEFLDQAGTSDKLNAYQRRIFVYPRPKAELYDIRKDPYEMDNLAAKPGYEKNNQRVTRGSPAVAGGHP